MCGIVWFGLKLAFLNLRSWAKVKMMMAKVDQFLDDLINYEKENIHPNIIAAIEPYLKVRLTKLTHLSQLFMAQVS